MRLDNSQIRAFFWYLQVWFPCIGSVFLKLKITSSTDTNHLTCTEMEIWLWPRTTDLLKSDFTSYENKWLSEGKGLLFSFIAGGDEMYFIAWEVPCCIDFLCGEFMLTIWLALIPAFTGTKSCNGLGGLWTNLIREFLMFPEQVRLELTEVQTSIHFKYGEDRYHWRENSSWGELDWLWEWPWTKTIEVKAVKSDLLEVIARGYVEHFTFIN